jgi:hypothetical protein
MVYHDSFGKLKVIIIDHNPKWDDKSRQERESFWIKNNLRPHGHVSSHQDIFQIFGFPESQDGFFLEDFAQFWLFLYGFPVLTNDVG